ncbi:uncharacterized protein LOC116342493 isoform X2 [Contarinia nasturtii]|uniref:uncharacterized protein LOC116342493 isoform X2 n=1 Tax=Contarinia nasturtii TaxID=265458 RepID=UPI0012D413D8|nr:uncharacterized protein LOC116342493 isoform X2 [Contarinia nasturtii]
MDQQGKPIPSSSVIADLNNETGAKPFDYDQSQWQWPVPVVDNSSELRLVQPIEKATINADVIEEHDKDNLEMDHERFIAIINQTLNLKGRPMANGAEFILYTEEETDLISKLEYDNPQSHGWYAKQVRGLKRKRTSILPAEIQAYIDNINTLKEEVPIPNVEDVVEIIADGKKYWMTPFHFEHSARAISEKLMWQYRVSRFGTRIQFFLKKIELTTIEQEIIALYYNETHKEGFATNQEWPRILKMVVSNHVFNTDWFNSSDKLLCAVPDCKAYIYPCLTLDGELKFKLVPHDENVAHSHETTPAPAPIRTVKIQNSTVQQRPSKQLTPTDFIHHWTPGGKKGTHFLCNGFTYRHRKVATGNYQGNWPCTKHRTIHCPAIAFERIINGVQLFAIVGDHNHNIQK